MRRAQAMVIAALSAWLALTAGCGGGSTAGNPGGSAVEDTSASGAAAAAVGGALTGTSNNAAVASTSFERGRAFTGAPVERGACPSTGSQSGCASSGDQLWLTLDDCTTGGKTFNGVLEITSSSAVSCGTTPSPGANGTLTRQYVKSASTTTPGELIEKTSFGTVSIIDDAGANLDNFDGVAITALLNGGYGAAVSFGANGGRSGITLGHRLSVDLLTDMSITGSVAITESPGAASREVTGQVTVYHNGLRVIATSTFDSVVHRDGCCLPISGTITTTFARGSVAPTAAGAKAIGATETLTLTGCGTGTLQSYDGTTEDVTLSRCF